MTSIIGLTLVKTTGMDMSEEEHIQKDKEDSHKAARNRRTGPVLYTFMSGDIGRGMLIFTVLAAVLTWMIADFTRIILRYAPVDAAAPILLVFYIIITVLLYINYLVLFDNIAVYERGISPPLSKEKRLWRTLPRFRTFIPFSGITDFETIDKPRPLTGIVFRALGKHWIFPSNWDIFNLKLVMEQGISNRYILDFELEKLLSESGTENSELGVEQVGMKGEVLSAETENPQ